MFWIKFLGVFVAMMVTDIFWTFYLISVEERKSVVAGLWAMALYISGAYVVSSYVGDKRFLVAAALGSFVGTWLTIEYKKRYGK